ncbi:secreted RxLR effector protein 161-like [Salvia splendens]|uniref:secreted RxLR effector protein 161-like n=1 Tax=Salvia splendens TaxID=180675 RepID=UPI001C27A8CD|nr:secreted RxLR effector protein 161-like [Salvia splendens]
MKDVGDAQKILGINIFRNRRESVLVLHQEPDVLKILQKFNMFAAKIASVPLAAHFLLSKDLCPKSGADIAATKKVSYANAIGSVMHLMVSTRLDIAYVVSCLSRYMSNPGPMHWEAMKWLLRYLIHTVKYGLCFSKCDDGVELCGFVDSNYANDKNKRKSTTSYVFTVCRSCISWKSQLQHIVALSTTKSKYIVITKVMKEAIWLKGVLSELKFLKATPALYSDISLPFNCAKFLFFIIELSI